MSSGNHFKRIWILGLALILWIPASTPLQAAPQEVTLTAANFERETGRTPVLMIISLDCDIGRYVSDQFRQAFKDLSGARLAIIDANEAYKIFTTDKPYDLGSVLLAHNGKVLSTTDEWVAESPNNSDWGMNGQRRWANEVMKRHNIRFEMGDIQPDRLAPQRETDTTVNLDRDLLARFRFDNDSPANEAGAYDGQFSIDKGETAHARLHSNAFYHDGEYDMDSGGYFSHYVDGGRPVYGNGFTTSVNFYFREDKENPGNLQNGRFFCIGYRMFCLGTYENKMYLEMDITGINNRENDDYVYSNDFYFFPEVKLPVKEWVNIVISSDMDSRRVKILINGQRVRDVRVHDVVYRMYTDYYRKGAVFSPYMAIQFFHFGAGDVLNGFADDLVVYQRGVNFAEMRALHRAYGKSSASIVTEVADTESDDVDFPDVTEPDDPPRPANLEALNRQLINASYSGTVSAAESALKSGAEVNTAQGDWTPLLIASYYGHTDLVRLLIRNGADAERKVGGWTAYQLAEHRNHTQVAALLNDYLNTERFYFERSIRPVRHRSTVQPPGI
ncbi:MAG: ankyrin repeat domain-containing protein [Leptospiraceae bacterium]|nr:ankyrin repeat domain-containing protein [Leptospiraceae bacterium]